MFSLPPLLGTLYQKHRLVACIPHSLVALLLLYLQSFLPVRTSRITDSGIYQFTAEQMQHLKRVIAGKSRAEATRLLLAQPGVSTVSLEVKGRETETLPSETSTIALLVIVPVA